MFIAQVAVGVLLGVAFGTYNTSNLPDSITYVALVLICIFVAGFAWSWGPLGWLVRQAFPPSAAACLGMGMCFVQSSPAAGTVCTPPVPPPRHQCSSSTSPSAQVPSEIQTLETRSAGFSLSVSMNFLWSFVLGQCFLSMLCAMEFGVFLFFAVMASLSSVLLQGRACLRLHTCRL